MREIPVLERPSFFDGQRLSAADLSVTQAYHRELRWLHNRSLHSWGIALGYAVSGRRGDRAVTIQPGFALDSLGRELVLSEVTTLPIPPVSPQAGSGQGDRDEAGDYYLIVSYAEDPDLPAETRLGLCNSDGAVRRPEKPQLYWLDPVETPYQPGIHVILASIQIENCQLAQDVSAARREALPAQQPYIASGSSTAAETVWSLWPDDITPFGVTAQIDTGSAGFRTSPRYMAQVIGTRNPSLLLNEGDPQETKIVVDGYVQIENPTAGAFDLVMLLLEGSNSLGDTPFNPPFVRSQPFVEWLNSEQVWYVDWMGVEGS